MTAIEIDPIPQALTANEQRVKELLDHGKSMFQIALRLHMGMPSVRDMIFEIRKKEAIMAGKQKLTEEERAEIIRKYQDGENTRDIADQYGISHGTVDNILNRAGVPRKRGGRPKKMQATGINEDFETAVDSMIAEMKSANAEPKAAITEPRPFEKVPKFIWDVLDDSLCNINYDIEQRVLRIKELQEEIEKLEEKRRMITGWLEAHHD